jgi:hypothetical protein
VVLSALGGGKFANGAVTATFQHVFNHELHEAIANMSESDRHSICSQMSISEDAVSGRLLECDPRVTWMEGDAPDAALQITLGTAGQVGIAKVGSWVWSKAATWWKGFRAVPRVVDAAESAGAKFVLEGLTKAEARVVAQGMGLPNAQAASVRSALSRATTSSTIRVPKTVRTSWCR